MKPSQVSIECSRRGCKLANLPLHRHYPKTMNSTMSSQTQQFMEMGFCSYEGVLDAYAQEHLRSLLDSHWQPLAGNRVGQDWGFGIDPLLPVLPEIAPYLAHPVIV